MSYEIFACSLKTKFSLASSFLEARAGGARRVRTAGERRVKSILDRLQLYARCHGRRKGSVNDPMGSLDLSE